MLLEVELKFLFLCIEKTSDYSFSIFIVVQLD